MRCARFVPPVVLLLLMVAACAGPQRLSISEYDFGPPRATQEGPPRLQREIAVADTTAPGWLDSPAIVYRLAYRDVAQPRAYVESRWLAPPAALFTVRLRQRLVATNRGGVLMPGDGVRVAATLRVELEEFSQVFDAPERSRALVRVRATLVSGGRLLGQTSFTIERSAPSADGAGAARALALAADGAIDRLIDWTAESLK